MWDGGNNDFPFIKPFIKPDLHIVVADALRPRQIATHHPGQTAARLADVVVINKINSARPDDVKVAKDGVRAVNPYAVIVLAASPTRLDETDAVMGKRVLVVEDGPTITHGGMAYGAGYVAAMAAGAKVVDPRPAAVSAIREVFDKYLLIGNALPAVGYGSEQLHALEATINAADADMVVSATPVDLTRVLHLEKKVVRVRYEFVEAGEPRLSSIVDAFIARMVKVG